MRSYVQKYCTASFPAAAFLQEVFETFLQTPLEELSVISNEIRRMMWFCVGVKLVSDTKGGT
jgi:hypothetical protein